MFIVFRIIIGLIPSFAIAACCMATTAVKVQGRYQSPGEMCSAVLKVSQQGGFFQLFIQTHAEKLVHMADDVTGFLWVDEKSLVFSSGPIYGKPGIFEVTCNEHERPVLKMLVGPKNINSAYPDGADYFELRGINGRNLHFFYGLDVDSIDFNEFHTEKYLRSMVLPSE